MEKINYKKICLKKRFEQKIKSKRKTLKKI